MTNIGNALRFLVSGKFWIGLLKVAMLLFVALMIYMQIPELRYDSLADRPVIINSPADLSAGLLEGTSYAKITGTPSFDYAFNYERYGLTFTYFTIEEYGTRIIARGYDLTESDFDHQVLLEGKLRPFESQPFAYAVRDLFAEQSGVVPRDDAFFLGVGDIPGANGWQLGSLIFASVLFGVMFYFFFLFRRGRRSSIFSNPLHGMVPDEPSRESVPN